MEKLIRGVKRLGLELDSSQVEKFNRYYRELTDWNTRVNLTRIVGWEEVQVKHFLDSLTVAAALPDVDLSRLKILDLGSGAGLPGVPLKILYPQIEIYLVDSVRKKTTFLEHLVAILDLDKVKIVTGRAEVLAHDKAYRESFDVVVSRSVAALATLLELALPFCKIGGRLIAQKEASYQREPGNLERALSLLHGLIEEVLPTELEGLDGNRRLVVVSKAGSTPDKYPRRTGVPTKRPL